MKMFNRYFTAPALFENTAVRLDFFCSGIPAAVLLDFSTLFWFSFPRHSDLPYLGALEIHISLMQPNPWSEPSLKEVFWVLALMNQHNKQWNLTGQTKTKRNLVFVFKTSNLGILFGIKNRLESNNLKKNPLCGFQWKNYFKKHGRLTYKRRIMSYVEVLKIPTLVFCSIWKKVCFAVK